MARHLCDDGHAVTVFNRTPERTRALVEAGARCAPTPAAAVAQAEVIIAIVADEAASRQIWLGEEGVLKGRPQPGAIAIESSTLPHRWVVTLGEAVAAAGLRFLDCPVTGGPDGARDRRLTLLLGGDEAVIAAARPVLASYGQRFLHFGPVGAGTAYKLIVNLMGAVQAAALAEGWLTAERAGLPLSVVAEALTSGAVASPLVCSHVDRLKREAHDDVYFAARWRHKDACYGLDLAATAGQPVPVATVAADLFGRCVSLGLGEQNSSIVIEVLRRMQHRGE